MGRVRMGRTQSGPHRYGPLEDCQDLIVEYVEEHHLNADDSDADALDKVSAVSYEGHLKWYHYWLEHIDKDPLIVDGQDARKMASQLKWEFNGTTPRNRWDRISNFHDWLVKNEMTDSNPYTRWDARQDLKLTKTTEQSKHVNDDEEYACTYDDISAMEQHPGRYEIRNQCIIRLMWHTGCRRDEIANIEMRDINQEKREIHIREAVAKNDKERFVAYQPSLDGLLSLWLNQRERWNENDYPNLFIGERGGKLDAESINDTIVRSAYRAGINRKLYADANAAHEILGYDGDDINPENIVKSSKGELIHEPTDTVLDEEKIEYGEAIPNRDLITSHNVRHGVATKMIQHDDCDPYRVSRYMGHESVEFTIRKYVEEDPRDGLPAIDDYRPDEDTQKA